MGRHSRHAQPAAPQQPAAPRSHRGRRRHHPLRTGMLTTSTALAVGAVVSSSGLLSSVADRLGYDDGAGTTQADAPDRPAQDGSDAPSPLSTTGSPLPGGTTTPSASGTPSPSASAATTKATPRATPTSAKPTPTRTSAAPTTPVRTVHPPTSPATASPTKDTVAATRAAILSLVNQERSTAGCKPLTASSALDGLAQAFSDDMAARGFFDHTDPDGDDPWDRAKARGITDLGGENIAKGQATAEAVMTAWMNSPGHRANILNCDYTTLGVGVHFGSGGPWWTQDFGY
ncbi:CAP domain-containing protein [Streptomyces sp. NPDC020983]|uniref:CAP domain-containing protein n=1 Tax=Streptomyces sp. NPDC020983 TaxID=3365106 RepID=UPI00379F7193